MGYVLNRKKCADTSKKAKKSFPKEIIPSDSAICFLALSFNAG